MVKWALFSRVLEQVEGLPETTSQSVVHGLESRSGAARLARVVVARPFADADGPYDSVAVRVHGQILD